MFTEPWHRMGGRSTCTMLYGILIGCRSGWTSPALRCLQHENPSFVDLFLYPTTRSTMRFGFKCTKLA